MEKFYIALCPLCDNQGSLEIVREVATGKLTIICNECDTEYKTPYDALHNISPKLYCGGKTALPTICEIEKAGWKSYVA